jgi:hypothetical protein
MLKMDSETPTLPTLPTPTISTSKISTPTISKCPPQRPSSEGEEGKAQDLASSLSSSYGRWLKPLKHQGRQRRGPSQLASVFEEDEEESMTATWLRWLLPYSHHASSRKQRGAGAGGGAGGGGGGFRNSGNQASQSGSVPKGSWPEGLSGCGSKSAALRFGHDGRLHEASQLLSSSRPFPLRCQKLIASMEGEARN